MDHQNKPQTRRNLKRKLEQEFQEDKSDRCKAAVVESRRTHQDIIRDVRIHVDVLNSCISFTEADRAASELSAHLLSALAKNGTFRIFNFSILCSGMDFGVYLLFVYYLAVFRGYRGFDRGVRGRSCSGKAYSNAASIGRIRSDTIRV